MGLLRKDCSLTAEWQTAVAISCGRSLIPTAVLIIKQIALIVFFALNWFYLFIYLLKIYLFIGKTDIQRGKIERKIFRPMIHTTSEPNDRRYDDLKPGSRKLFQISTRVQGPKALGCPRLLSQATIRELDGSGAARIRTVPIWDYGTFKARTLATRPRRWAHSIGFNINCLYF